MGARFIFCNTTSCGIGRNVPPFVFSNSERFGVDREFPLLSNELTAYLDLTQVYGSDEHTANALRNGTYCRFVLCAWKILVASLCLIIRARNLLLTQSLRYCFYTLRARFESTESQMFLFCVSSIKYSLHRQSFCTGVRVQPPFLLLLYLLQPNHRTTVDLLRLLCVHFHVFVTSKVDIGGLVISKLINNNECLLVNAYFVGAASLTVRMNIMQLLNL